MPLSQVDLQTPQTKEEVRTILTDLLTGLGFPVTAWQETGSARSLLEAQAALGAQFTEFVAALAKVGFLSSAEEEYLTALAKSHYDEDRNDPVSSVFDIDLINTGGVTHTPAAGEVILRATNGQTFTNTGAETVSAGSTTTAEFFAQIPGGAGNIGAQNLELVTPLAGVIATFLGTFTTAGADAESDLKLRERARSKWGTLRVEKVNAGVSNLARKASPSIHGVSIDDMNPRGAGTVDVYLSAVNATAGDADVALVQTALDSAFFGNGEEIKRVLALPAPTVVQDIAVNLYVRSTTEEEAKTALLVAWQALLLSTPVGGFDLSPGPTNVVQRGQISDALASVPGTVSIDVTTPAGDLAVPPHTKVLEGASAFNVVVLTS